MAKKDLTGKSDGLLTFLRPAPPRGTYRKRAMWFAQCNLCGKECIKRADSFGRGFACGCQHKIDISGKRFGRLLVKDYSEYRQEQAQTYWLCVCECGKEFMVVYNSLVSGNTSSCGCLKNTMNGLSETRLGKIYTNMTTRCSNPKSTAYKDYGARGITVCQEWLDDFMNFYNWAMDNGYVAPLTLERNDVNGNYCPENCTWIPKSEQSKNTTRSLRFNVNGRCLNIFQFQEEFCPNASIGSIRQQVGKGKTPEQIKAIHDRKAVNRQLKSNDTPKDA